MKKTKIALTAFLIFCSSLVAIPGKTLAATSAKPFDYELIKQSPDSEIKMESGETKMVWLEVKNTGTVTWKSSGIENVVRLGTGSIYDDQKRGSDYNSSFYYTSGAASTAQEMNWIAKNRPSSLTNGTVAISEVRPGWHTRFQFTIKAPLTAGIYKEYFTPVVEGVEWMKDMGIYWTINVTKPSVAAACVPDGGSLGTVTENSDLVCCDGLEAVGADSNTGLRGTCKKKGLTTRSSKAGDYNYQYVSQSAHPSAKPGENIKLKLSIKNTGVAPWYDSGAYAIKIGTSSPQDRESPFYAGNLASCSACGCPGISWQAKNRIILNKTQCSGDIVVNPGQIAEFNIDFVVPQDMKAGKYKEYFTPMIDDLVWLDDIGIYFEINVLEKTSQDDSGLELEDNNQNTNTDTETAVLQSLTISPSGSVNIQSGQIQDFILSGTYSDGSVKDVTSQAMWTVINDTGTGTIHTEIPGRFISGGIGSCRIRTQFNDMTQSVDINITSL